MKKTGIWFIIIGVGSFILPLIGLQFRIISIFGRYQNIVSIAFIVIGVILNIADKTPDSESGGSEYSRYRSQGTSYSGQAGTWNNSQGVGNAGYSSELGSWDNGQRTGNVDYSNQSGSRDNGQRTENVDNNSLSGSWDNGQRTGNVDYNSQSGSWDNGQGLGDADYSSQTDVYGTGYTNSTMAFEEAAVTVDDGLMSYPDENQL